MQTPSVTWGSQQPMMSHQTPGAAAVEGVRLAAVLVRIRVRVADHLPPDAEVRLIGWSRAPPQHDVGKPLILICSRSGAPCAS